jgi:imidazolonepropionase-like amidohydrolase
VIPTLVDSHTHLTWSGTSDQNIRSAQLNASYETAKVTIQRHLEQYQACGILAVRDGGDRFGHTLKFKNEPDFSTYKIHIGAAGTAWHAPGRYGRLIGKESISSQGLADTIRTYTPVSDHIKLVNSGLNSLTEFGKQTSPQFDFQTIKQVVDLAHSRGCSVMVHANGKLPVQMAIEAGCDSIEHGFFMGSENLNRMSDARVTWVPTAITMQAYAQMLPKDSVKSNMARRNLEHQLEQLHLAHKLGVRVAAGTDAGSLGVHHGFALIQEINLLLEAGFSISKAIACASSTGAKLLNMKYHGKLSAGYKADFIALEGDPEGAMTQLKKAPHIYLKGNSGITS